MKKQTDYELKQWLDEFKIEFPDEAEIEQTITKLHQYVPEQKTAKFIPVIIQNAFQEMLSFSKTFWISNLVYLIVGLTIITWFDGNPYMTLLFLAPLPVLIGFVDIFRGRDEGMIELELTLKHSRSQIILSKLVITGIFNLACNLILIVIMHFFASPITLTDLLRYWAVPYMVSISVCLFLSIKFRTLFTAPITIAVLFSFGMAVAQMDIPYEEIPGTYFWIILLLTLGFLALDLIMIKKGDYHEFNN